MSAKLSDKTALFLTHNYFSFTKDQIEALAPAFKKIVVLVRYKPIAELARWLPLPGLEIFRKDYVIQARELPANVEVHALPMWYLPFDGSYRQLGQKHFKAAREWIEARGLRFDLVHGHFLWTAGYAAVELGRHYGVPSVVTGHGYDVYELPFQDADWRRRIVGVLDAASSVLTVSHSNAKLLKDLVPAKAVEVLPNGFKPERFGVTDRAAARKKLGLTAEQPLLLSVGNLVPIKGHAAFLEALAILAKHRDFRAVLVGDGPARRSLETRIRELKLEERVRLVGKVPHGEVGNWMAAADVFCFPSRRESFGVAALEALASGTPVVTTANGGTTEFIDESCGRVVPVDDPAALAQGLDEALGRNWDRDALAARASEYTWPRIANSLNRVYSEVL